VKVRLTPAADLVVVHLGQHAVECRGLGVLVQLRAPANADRGRQLGAVDDRDLALQDRASLFGSDSGSPSGPHSSASSRRSADAASISPPASRSHRRAPPPRAHPPSCTRPPRAAASRTARRSRHPSRARRLGEPAARRHHDALGAALAAPRRTPRASPRSRPSSSSRGRACPRETHDGGAYSREVTSGRRARSPIAPRARSRRSPSRPCRRRRARYARRPARCPRTATRHSASSSWCGWLEDVVEHPPCVHGAIPVLSSVAHPISSPGCTRASSSTTAPRRCARPFRSPRPGATSAPSPIRAPSATMHSRRLQSAPTATRSWRTAALDARVGSHAAMVPDDRLRADVRAARQAALVDERAGLVALGKRAVDNGPRAGPTCPRGSARASRCPSSTRRRGSRTARCRRARGRSRARSTRLARGNLLDHVALEQVRARVDAVRGRGPGDFSRNSSTSPPSAVGTTP
jgi:hypothetical protein